MKILHVLGKLDRGGVETWLVQVLRNIDRSKYQMDFVVHTTMPGAYDDEVRALGSKIIPCLKPSNPMRYAWNFRRVLRERGPYDVVHSHVHHYSGYVLSIARSLGVRVRIAHSHNDTAQAERRARALRKAYLHLTASLVDTASTARVAASSWAGQSLFRSDFVLCPYGVELVPFRNSSSNDGQLRRSLGIPTDHLVVGHVGRFHPQKNHRFLVRIAEEVVKRRPNVTFLLVGDGFLRPSIEMEVAGLGLKQNFVFAGLRPDVPKVMKEAMDVYLFPSTHEGLGIVVLEAQLAGLPSIISDRVPSEADLFPRLIDRESLKTSASEWAERVLGAAGRKPITEQDWAHAERERSIQASVKRLTEIYEGQVG